MSSTWFLEATPLCAAKGMPPNLVTMLFHNLVPFLLLSLVPTMAALCVVLEPWGDLTGGKVAIPTSEGGPFLVLRQCLFSDLSWEGLRSNLIQFLNRY